VKVEPLAVAGAFVIDVERHADERGFFARTFCASELAKSGIAMTVAQCNFSYNARRGTLRGMHYQRPALGESKIVRVVRGAIYDVVLDMRPSSPTYLRWDARELGAENMRSMYLPDGCAHGFITLTDDAELLYLMGAPYEPHAAAGVRWDDPAFGIKWPIPVVAISERDRTYPDFRPEGT